jgi:superfamily I DNA/RNA helicase
MALDRGSSDYACVVADEIQDFRTADLVLLRALVPAGPNDIFVVGDPHQRIYGHMASLSRCGISVLGRRSRKLRVNYRTTQEIRNWAVRRLEGMTFDDLDEGTDDLGGERSLRLGNKPQVEMFASHAKEVDAIVGWIREWLGTGELQPADICVCARTSKLVQDYVSGLAELGIAVHVVETKIPNAADNKVRVATMHRVKGLEFSRVILAGIRASTLPYHDTAFDRRDETARELYVEGERRLLYVAATRARDELRVCGWGERSQLLGG